MKGAKLALVLGMFLALVLLTEAVRSRKDSSNQNSFRRAASGFYQTLSNFFGEENIRALYKVHTRSRYIVMLLCVCVCGFFFFEGALDSSIPRSQAVNGRVSKPSDLPT